MNNPFFQGVKERFGFGCMRLPMKGEEIDIEQFKIMVDRFLEKGFNYFDTAHGYLNMKSEPALKEALTSRYPRDRYFIADKLTSPYFDSEDDIRKVFQAQLSAVGVTYFDFYLMHAQSRNNYDKFQSCHAYDVAKQLKQEGKIKHIGFSFHDDYDMLKRILDDHPEVEFVQIQFNYLDYESEKIQSRKLYELLESRNLPVVIMEPVKGGSLVNLPRQGKEILDNLHGGSYASYALRFASQFKNVAMVLSGMSNIEQMEDNLSFMKDVKPLNEEELKAIYEVVNIINNKELIPCTGCSYCVAGCPMKIAIPDLFLDLNNHVLDKKDSYQQHIANKGKASDCIKCGQCENICPQQLKIRNLLEKVSKTFE